MNVSGPEGRAGTTVVLRMAAAGSLSIVNGGEKGAGTADGGGGGGACKNGGGGGRCVGARMGGAGLGAADSSVGMLRGAGVVAVAVAARGTGGVLRFMIDANSLLVEARSGVGDVEAAAAGAGAGAMAGSGADSGAEPVR